VDGDRVSSIKESTEESVKDQGGVCCVFDRKGIVYHEFVPRGQMVNKQLYQEVLARLKGAVRRKKPKLWENQTRMLYHDIASRRAAAGRSPAEILGSNPTGGMDICLL